MSFGRSRGPAAEYWDCYYNYYSRCSFQCKYCWALNWKKDGPIHLADTLENLPRYIDRYQPSEIMLSNTADAYQSAERTTLATRTILEYLEKNYPELDVCILTKSPLVLRDIKLLSGMRCRVGLTELFEEVRNPNTPIMVERVVNDIDEIVRYVRFEGWQNTHEGEREVKIALRRTLFKYKLHQDVELFDKAYGYIRQYY